MKFLRSKPRIVFMYAESYKYSGSTIMRGEQLMSIVKRFYGKNFKFTYKPISVKHRDSLIFLTKGAVTDITNQQISELVKRGNYVLIDPVDNPLDIDKAKVASGVVAASLEAFDDYKGRGFNTYLVNHHVDPRLRRKNTTPLTKLRCGYFGELINTVITDKISTLVDFIHVDTGKQSADWFIKPCEYNLHYAVRSATVAGFKPFLKGFTAAACGANIIIQKDQKEAVRWLGEDYPYLLPSDNPTEQEIIDMLAYVKKSFGSNEWKKASRKMELIKNMTSDKVIAEEFVTMVKSVVA